MPRGIIFVLIANSLLLAVFAGNLLVFYAQGVTKTLTFIVSWAVLAGLLAVMFGIVLRGRLWHQISRISLYGVAIVFGLELMGMVSEILNWKVALSALGSVATILYLIGARGYLNSAPGRHWFLLDAPNDAPPPSQAKSPNEVAD